MSEYQIAICPYCEKEINTENIGREYKYKSYGYVEISEDNITWNLLQNILIIHLIIILIY